MKAGFLILIAVCFWTPQGTRQQVNNCPPNTFGPDCSIVCDCRNGGLCDDGPNGSGACACLAGFYGPGCAGICACPPLTRCSDGASGNGDCYCIPGVTASLGDSPAVDCIQIGAGEKSNETIQTEEETEKGLSSSSFSFLFFYDKISFLRAVAVSFAVVLVLFVIGLLVLFETWRAWKRRNRSDSSYRNNSESIEGSFISLSDLREDKLSDLENE